MKSIIVGFGRIANSIRFDLKMAKAFPMASHAQVLTEHPGFDWIGVVDPYEEARKQAAAWKVPHIVSSVEEIVPLEPEFAVLAVPPGQRLGIIKSIPSLRAVLIEKPLGAEGGELVNWCEEHGISASVNFWRRGVQEFQELRDSLRSDVGQPQAVQCLMGNGLFNNGSHLVDFLRMLFGNVRRVVRIGEARQLYAVGCSGPANDWNVAFALEMDGFTITIQPIDFNRYREVSVDIWGEKGRISLYQESLALHKYPMVDHRAMTNQREIASDDALVRKVDVSRGLYNIYSAIHGGHTLTPAWDALETEWVLNKVLA